MSKKDIVLKAENIHKSYGDINVLKGISLELKRGETKVIIGPSGGGKSTLLRCLNLLTLPDKGRVWLEEQEITGSSPTDINKHRQKIGFVFQHFGLFTHLTALRNVSIALEKVKKMSKEEARRIALEKLRWVGIEKQVNQYPAQLSGGQQQRVGIARALAMEPAVMFFDEPTSALDPELIGEVLEVMERLAREKVTNLIVTHEMGFARSVAKEIMFLVDGEILEKGTPEQILDHPNNERTKRFLRHLVKLYGEKRR